MTGECHVLGKHRTGAHSRHKILEPRRRPLGVAHRELDPSGNLDIQIKDRYILNCIKSGADALANLPSRARWFSKGDAATSATKRVAPPSGKSFSAINTISLSYLRRARHFSVSYNLRGGGAPSFGKENRLTVILIPNGAGKVRGDFGRPFHCGAANRVTPFLSVASVVDLPVDRPLLR